MPLLDTMALLGSALVGGIFFAFSSFVMKALARVPSAEGIGAMQSINVVVLNPGFLGAFFGTAVLSLGAAGLAVASWGRPSAPYFLGGTIFYLVGTLLATVLGNVPLNDQLVAVRYGSRRRCRMGELSGPVDDVEPRSDGRRNGRRAAVYLGSLTKRRGLMSRKDRCTSCDTPPGPAI